MVAGPASTGSGTARDASWWFDQFRASMRAVDNLPFGLMVVDAHTGGVVGCNAWAAELVGGRVPHAVEDLVDSGALSRRVYEELVVHAEAPGPESWRSDITLHLAGGPSCLSVVAACVDEPRFGARAIVAMLCEQGREWSYVDRRLPDTVPRQLGVVYDDHLRVRAIDPRLADGWSDPGVEVGSLLWLAIHPADIHLAHPWTERLVTGELASAEFTVRVRTPWGRWAPVQFALRRLLGITDAAIVATLDLVEDFRATIAPGQLTRRERAVVSALFDGRRIPQIAERDGVSVKTLRNQLTAVFRKLGVSHQGELLETYHRPADC